MHAGFAAGTDTLVTKAHWYGVAIASAIYISALPILLPILAGWRQAWRQQRKGSVADPREIGSPK